MGTNGFGSGLGEDGGGEGDILRAVLWHSIVLACLVGLLTLPSAIRFGRTVAMPTFAAMVVSRRS